MRRDDDMLPALRSVGDQLHEAARRELAPAARRRRRRRRILAIAVAALLVAAAAAGAARLIGVGEPTEDTRQPAGLAPGAPGRIVLRVSDPGGLPWAARAYTSRDGRSCMLAGQLRGLSLGVVRGGTFHPYPASAVGVCGEVSRVGFVFDAVTFREPRTRSIVYGRTRPGVRGVMVEVPGAGPRRVRVGRDAAFLLLYDGPVKANEVKVTAE
jgi:hypothetical protein